MVADGIRLDCGDAEQRDARQGRHQLRADVGVGQEQSKYYFIERDPVAIGGPTNFNPFTNTEKAPRRCGPTRRRR